MEQVPQHRLEQWILLGDCLRNDLAFAPAVASKSGDGREILGNGTVAEGIRQVAEVDVVRFNGLGQKQGGVEVSLLGCIGTGEGLDISSCTW